MVNQFCTHFFARNWQLPFLNQRTGENNRRNYFVIKFPRKNVADPTGIEPAFSLITSQTCIQWVTEAGSTILKYTSDFRSQFTYSFVKCGCSVYFFITLQIWYVEVMISRTISESPLDFITKTCLFKYTENFTTKKWKFADKKSDIFHISAQNIDCGTR